MKRNAILTLAAAAAVALQSAAATAQGITLEDRAAVALQALQQHERLQVRGSTMPANIAPTAPTVPTLPAFSASERQMVELQRQQGARLPLDALLRLPPAPGGTRQFPAGPGRP